MKKMSAGAAIFNPIGATFRQRRPEWQAPEGDPQRCRVMFPSIHA
jgi:hypothetical protein